jgi:endogenous inhibitor of DNA gyrase (YacG/DUF329 family)
MIRSALSSLSYLAEGMVSLAKWMMGEAVAELDNRLQPEHVQQGWAAAETLNGIEAEIDAHEPNAPYLQWGGPETWPQECGRCHRVRKLDEDSGWCQECLNGPFEGPHYAPYCNRCGYPHPTTQKCKRDEAAESARCAKCGTTLGEIACVSDVAPGMFCSDRCRKVAEIRAAMQSSAVPPTADRPAGVVADPPSAPPAGHPYYEVFVPEEDRVPTSELLDSAAHMIGLFNRDNVATALMSQLRTRAEQFKAVENTT